MIHAPSALQHRRNVHVRASNSPYGMQYLPNILSEIPYDENYVNGTKKKFLKLILPDYPLVENPQGVLTFFRYQFSENNNWERIKKPMIYSKNKDYPFFNIGFGYSIIQYN